MYNKNKKNKQGIGVFYIRKHMCSPLKHSKYNIKAKRENSKMKFG